MPEIPRSRAVPPDLNSAPLFTGADVRRLLNGLSLGAFFVACMTVPLVGRAAAATAWYGSNALVYGGILLAGLAASAGSVLAARRTGAAPGRLPWLMAGVFALMLVLLLTGRFKA